MIKITLDRALDKHNISRYELAKAMLYALLVCLDRDLAPMGLTAEDLGFLNY